MNIVLFEPEIPQNTGNIIRTCMASNTILHLIEPLGFSMDEKHLRRSGMDYIKDTEIHIHKNWDEFVKENPTYFGINPDTEDSGVIELAVSAISSGNFTPTIAEAILKATSTSASIWHISPLQDYLYMDKSYWLEDATMERINIPGTVNNFNWTYRIPVSLEELAGNKELISKIQEISKR